MRYLGEFNNSDDVFSNFNVSEEDQQGVCILLAFYGQESYEGNAFVLYIKNGDLFEVNGSHCSCVGLEDQWEPEKTSWEALDNMYLKNKNSNIYCDDGSAVKALQDLIIDEKVDEILLN